MFILGTPYLSLGVLRRVFWVSVLVMSQFGLQILFSVAGNDLPGHVFKELPDLKKLYMNNNPGIDSVNENLLQSQGKLEVFQIQVQ